MANFGKGKKIGERNKRKMTDFGREKLEMGLLQVDLIGRETDRKFMGKLDLLFFYFLDRKVILDLFFLLFRFLDILLKIKID